MRLVELCQLFAGNLLCYDVDNGKLLTQDVFKFMLCQLYDCHVLGEHKIVLSLLDTLILEDPCWNLKTELIRFHFQYGRTLVVMVTSKKLQILLMLRLGLIVLFYILWFHGSLSIKKWFLLIYQWVLVC